MKDLKFIHLLAVFAILMFFVLIWDFIGIVIFAIITAFFAQPLYEKSLKKLKKNWLAISTTWVWIILTILLPIGFLVMITYNQTVVFVSDVSDFIISEQSISELLSKQNIPAIIDKVDVVVEEIGFEFDAQKVYENIFQITKATWEWIKNLVLWVASSVTSTIIGLFIYFSTTTALFVNRKKILETIKDISPLKKAQTEIYLVRIGSMLDSIVKGTFVIAFIQWLITWISFAIADVSYTLFWTVLVMFLSLIPFLGAGIIAVPIAIVLILMWDIWQWIMILIVNIIIVWNIDTILRARFTGDKAKIHPSFMILSIFGGMALFGIVWIFYGPIIMLFILTTIEFYIKEIKTNRKETKISKK